MPTFTPTYIYIGNELPLFNPNWNGATEAERDTTLTEASTMVGKEFGAKDMQGVTISATSASSANIQRGESLIDYTIKDFDLAGNEIGSTTVNDVVYTGHIVMAVDIDAERELPDGTIERTTFENLRAAVIQMSNGDVFVRPYFEDVGIWNTALDGWAISDLRLDSVYIFPTNPAASTDAFSNGMNGSAGFSPKFAGSQVGAPCFAAGTLITTVDGPRRVEDLQVGDLILTRDNGYQPLRWINRTRIDGLNRAYHAPMRPIRLAAGSLGQGMPAADLLVSPQHRVLVRSRIARTMFGTDEVLVPARTLTALAGVAVADDLPAVEYVHFMFDRHEIVLSNGLHTESLYAGPVALQRIDAAARAELLAIFPELRNAEYRPDPARPLVQGARARRLAERHAKNNRPLNVI